MDKNSVFGEVLEKGQNAVANTVSNAAANTASDISQTVAEQLGAKPKTQQQAGQQVKAQQPQAQATQDQTASPQAEPRAQSSEATLDIVEDFYSPSDHTSNTSSHPQGSSDTQTQEKLANVRRELSDMHKTEYYDPLFAYEKKKPEPRKADVAAQEEQAKMQELSMEQQQQNSDLALTRAKIAVEANRGVAG